MLGTGAWQVTVDAPRPSRRYRPAVRDICWVWRCLYEVSRPGTGTARSHTAGCRYRVCTSCMRPCWQTGHTTPGSPTTTSGLLGSVASSRAWARGAWPKRLRHFGFLANRVRQAKLAQCRTLLGPTTLPQPRPETGALKPPEVSAGEPGAVCPVCQHGRMQLVQTFYRQPGVWDLAVPAPGLDTS
jgi:hypothetical protein